MLPVISDPESLQSSTSPSSDDAASLLSDPRYRRILRRLETTTPTSVVDLADHLALEEADGERARIAELGDALIGTRRRVRLSLRHAHLPALADAGLVHFDPASNLVSLSDPGADRLARAISIDECENQSARADGGESLTQ